MPVFPSMTDVNLIKVLQMLLDAPEEHLSNFYLQNRPLSPPTSPSLSLAGSPAELSAASHTGKDLKRAATDGGSNTLARKVLNMLPGQMGNLARADDAVIQLSKVFDLPDPGPSPSSRDQLQLLFDHSGVHTLISTLHCACCYDAIKRTQLKTSRFVLRLVLSMVHSVHLLLSPVLIVLCTSLFLVSLVSVFLQSLLSFSIQCLCF